MPSAYIKGIGFYVPENIVTNADLQRHMDTTDEWIQERTGIQERRYGTKHKETTSVLGTNAAKKALANAGTSVQRFWQVTGGEDWFDDSVTVAPIVVLPLADPTAYTSRYAEGDKAGHGLESADNWEVPFWLTDAAMATQNLLLLAEERGLGALYFGIFRNARRALDEFGVPPHVLQVGAVALGLRSAGDVPSGSATTRPRRARIDVVHQQRW